MRKIVFTILVSVFTFSILYSQSIVTTNPQLNAVLIENFTGINCPFCPDANNRIDNLMSDHPGVVIGIGIHEGPFASPNNSSHPDFRTEFGTALAGQASVAGYPAATVNRQVFSDLSMGGGTAIGRGEYAQAVARVINTPAYANIGLESSYNESTREVSIDVEAYYVENLPIGVNSNFINIAIIENDIIGYQTPSGNSYSHKRVLRTLVTGQWGDEVENVKAGDVISRTYTFTLDEEWVADNSQIVAFITETRQQVINAAKIDLIDGYSNGEVKPDFGRIFSNDYIKRAEQWETVEFDLTAVNGLDDNSSFKIGVGSDVPQNWDYWFEVDGTVHVEDIEISMQAFQTKDIKLFVKSSDASGVAKVDLSFEQVGTDNKQNISVYVVSGIENLIVNGSGLGTGIKAEDYAEIYENSLSKIDNINLGIISADAFSIAYQKNLMPELQSIFFNIGHTTPVLSVEQAEILKDFIDNGGNLFIAGQDIGRDIMGAGGNSTTMSIKMFYQNYLSAAFANFGNDSNNEILFEQEDSVFGEIPNSELFNPYDNAALHPDNISPINEAVSFIKYPSNMHGGIRNIVDNSKTVYLAFGLEQVQNEDTRDLIIKQTYKWFNDQINEESSIQNIASKNFNLYPNPANNVINIEIQNTYSTDVKIDISCISGKIIKSFIANDDKVTIDVSNLSKGIYVISFSDNNSVIIKKFIKH